MSWHYLPELVGESSGVNFSNVEQLSDNLGTIGIVFCFIVLMLMNFYSGNLNTEKDMVILKQAVEIRELKAQLEEMK